MPLDLRAYPCDDVINRIQKTLQTRFDPASEVRKRRSAGFHTERNTWVRIEVRELTRVDSHGWGVESASVLHGISMASWHQGVSWIDREQGVMWRADETQYVADRAIKAGGILTSEPLLPEVWWTTFNESLTALADHTTSRTATPGLQPITQARVTDTIHKLFPDIDTAVEEWTAAHADLAWPNLTAPTCYLLDWEDWGMAPRGWDAATLWSESLAVSTLAKRIHQERRADLETRTGKLARLFHCAKLIVAGDRSGPLLEPAQVAADELVIELAG